MAEIITKDSEEFKELTGWIKRCGRALENATARIRPGIADEHYLTGEEVCEKLHVSRRTLQGREGNPVHFHYRRRRQAAIPGKRTVRGTEKELQGLQAICQINKRHVF